MIDSNCLQKASLIAIENDKQISLDYYETSQRKECKIVKSGEDKMLYKSNDEFTSPLVSMYKVGGDVILETQNTIYIVSGKMI